MINILDRGLSSAPITIKLVNTFCSCNLQLQSTIQLDELSDASVLEEFTLNERAKELLVRLRKSSLHAWVMKPFVSTGGMREGS